MGSIFSNVGSEAQKPNYNFAIGDLGNFVEEMRIPVQDMNITEDVQEDEFVSNDDPVENLPFELDDEFGEIVVDVVDMPVALFCKWWSKEVDATSDMFGFSPTQKKTLTRLTNKVLEKRGMNLSPEWMLGITFIMMLSSKVFTAHQLRVKNIKIQEDERLLLERQEEINRLNKKLNEKESGNEESRKSS